VSRGAAQAGDEHTATDGRRGVHRVTLSEQAPSISTAGTGIHASGIHAYMVSLAARLRRVRVVCGDWSRVVTPAVTHGIGLTGVLLDPPYGAARTTELYSQDSMDVAASVRSWAVLNGDNPDLRIALCGYDGEHEMPDSWECVRWTARGGYGSQRKDGTDNENRKKERIWFSPHCLKVGLFGFDSEQY
jgi:hypothetical protein